MLHFLSEDQAAVWLIDNVIPWVNIESDDELREQFPKLIGNEKASMGLKFPNVPIRAYHTRRLIETRDFLKDMLSITLMREREAALPETLKDRIPATEARILSHFQSGRTSVEWKGQGECFFLTSCQELTGELGAFEHLAVCAILKCLYSLHEKYFYTGTGFHKIGLCPNCGIFFEKKRKDQEFCSKRCGSNVRVKKAYQKKK